MFSRYFSSHFSRQTVIRMVAISLAIDLQLLRQGTYVSLAPALSDVGVDEIDAVVDELRKPRNRVPLWQPADTFSHTRLRRALCA